MALGADAGAEAGTKAEAGAGAETGAEADGAPPGYESGRSAALHYETSDRLAELLSQEEAALHEWVAAESSRLVALPEAYAEAWALYERGEQALLEAGDAEGGGGGLADAESLQARLRRKMRHSMHLMMQRDNPESYYKDVEHVEPT